MVDKKSKKQPKTSKGKMNKMMTGDGRKNPAKEFAKQMGLDTSKKSKKEPTTAKGMLSKTLTGKGNRNPCKQYAEQMGLDTSKKSRGKKKKK
ncbi:hypothetical protein [Methanohalophilus halophilus]|uniref:Uncharacterized protein n=1 Tax=Methanohalophilus halophilus TaxID=2177 RepID=A0A1L3PZR0_9EURY|nr:hypothetical protein [Methanohalophilus halophilus]APH38095.1 hypothetical protein BHR79_00440 [Methanohalophilus halophilus]RNI11041.1 hypothetical protein EFE40_02365 [Methanohalophilus halophilus]SDW83147.1 hypothetical protein SAMN04515625_1691 [Methanohalophilus halophilus]